MSFYPFLSFSVDSAHGVARFGDGGGQRGGGSIRRCPDDGGLFPQADFDALDPRHSLQRLGNVRRAVLAHHAFHMQCYFHAFFLLFIRIPTDGILRRFFRIARKGGNRVPRVLSSLAEEGDAQGVADDEERT